MIIHTAEQLAQNGPGGKYIPCDWSGPEGRRCCLSLGHPLMKVGWMGHAPDRPVPAEKPGRAADPHGFPPAPERPMIIRDGEVE